MDKNGGPTPLEIIAYVLGAIGIGYFFWKSTIDGYYPWEAAPMYAAGAVGLAALGLGGWLARERRRRALEASDRAHGVE